MRETVISAIPPPPSPFNVTSHNCVTEVWQILSLLSSNICHNRNQFQSFILFWYKYFKRITCFLHHSHQTLLTSRLFIGLVALFSAWLCLLEVSGFEQVPWSFCTSVSWGWWLTTPPPPGTAVVPQHPSLFSSLQVKKKGDFLYSGWGLWSHNFRKSGWDDHASSFSQATNPMEELARTILRFWTKSL